MAQCTKRRLTLKCPTCKDVGHLRGECPYNKDYSTHNHHACCHHCGGAFHARKDCHVYAAYRGGVCFSCQGVDHDLATCKFASRAERVKKEGPNPDVQEERVLAEALKEGGMDTLLNRSEVVAQNTRRRYGLPATGPILSLIHI